MSTPVDTWPDHFNDNNDDADSLSVSSYRSVYLAHNPNPDPSSTRIGRSGQRARRSPSPACLRSTAGCSELNRHTGDISAPPGPGINSTPSKLKHTWKASARKRYDTCINQNVQAEEEEEEGRAGGIHLVGILNSQCLAIHARVQQPCLYLNCTLLWRRP